MMLNDAPPNKKVSAIVDQNDTKKAVDKKEERAEKMKGFQENYVIAYRKCQDKPGGKKIVAFQIYAFDELP